MKEEKIIIEFKYPWTMMPLENAEEWINAVKGSLTEDDPLFKKEIFVKKRSIAKWGVFFGIANSLLQFF